MDGFRDFEQDREEATEELPSITALTEKVIEALAEDARREREAALLAARQPLETAA